MNVGDTYLVFLDERIETYNELNLYRLAEYYPSPVYSYDNNEQGYHQCENEDGSTDILYSEVKNEEFFLMSQDAVDKMAEFKKELFEKYPR